VDGVDADLREAVADFHGIAGAFAFPGHRPLCSRQLVWKFVWTIRPEFVRYAMSGRFQVSCGFRRDRLENGSIYGGSCGNR